MLYVSAAGLEDAGERVYEALAGVEERDLGAVLGGDGRERRERLPERPPAALAPMDERLVCLVGPTTRTSGGSAARIASCLST
jgi:hypothetical protein